MHKLNNKIIITLLFIFLCVLLYSEIFAQSGSSAGRTSVRLVNPLGNVNSFEDVLDNVMTWFVRLGAPLATLMIIIGGLQMLFAGGSPEKFKKGQSTILYTAIGYGIIILGSGIIKIIKALLSTR